MFNKFSMVMLATVLLAAVVFAGYNYNNGSQAIAAGCDVKAGCCSCEKCVCEDCKCATNSCCSEKCCKCGKECKCDGCKCKAGTCK